MSLEIATGIAHWLKSRQSAESGRVVDSVHQVPGSYADGFASLVFSLLEWKEPRQGSLQVSLQRRADSEFDSLAQALILCLAPDTLSGAERQRLLSQPLYQGSMLVSNNWGLFRALTRSLRGQLKASFAALDQQLPGGLFPDSPVGVATPVCYHAKMCATLALLQELCPEASRPDSLRRGLDALLALVSPQGVLVPYGRSRNTLFAYGSAYLALRLGAKLFGDGRLAGAAAAVLAHMKKFQDADGHIPAVLNHNEWLRQDWDIYINNPDYNAYAAACLLLAGRLAPELPPPSPAPNGTFDLGPILVCHHSSAYFACSTTGEFAPYGSPFFCDTRYAGLVPLLYDDGEQVRSFDENYCWDGRDCTRSALVDPRISDWIPFLEIDRRRYWVRHYEAVTWSLQADVLQISGSGLPATSQPIPRWRRFLASKLRGGPTPQLNHQTLTHLFETTLRLDFGQQKLTSQSAFPSSQSVLRRAALEENLCST